MNQQKPIIALILLFFVIQVSAQRVHYKDNYYTLVNSKIFHLGHNVYGKLTQGERDTLYMIARELYNDKGKLKPHYRERRKRDRYKLPEGFWDQKTDSLANKETEAVSNMTENNDSQQSVLIKENSAEKKEDVLKMEVSTQKRNEIPQDDIERKDAKEIRSKKQKAQKSLDREENKLGKKQKKKEKEEKGHEQEQRKEKKQRKKKEKELQQKQKAITNHKEARKTLKKAEEKYLKLKEKGELSPNDEVEWLEKIEKLKEKLAKAEKKVD